MIPKTILGRNTKLNEIYYAVPLMKLKNTYTRRKHNISFRDGHISKHILNKMTTFVGKGKGREGMASEAKKIIKLIKMK